MRTWLVCSLLLLGACGASAGRSEQGPPSATASAGEVTSPTHAVAPEVARYEVDIEVPATAKAGQAVMARLVVEPRAPLHMNVDYPAKLELSKVAGVQLDATVLRRGDAERLDDDALVFPIVFTTAKRGHTTVEGEVHFAVCGVAECSPVKIPVSFSVEFT